MAVNLVSVRPIGVRAYATGGHRKPDRKSSSSNWWTPLFGWSSKTDYIERDNSIKADLESKSGADRDPKTSSRSRFAPGTFTDEKAKRLRMMTTGTAAFYEAMYHSAIASRLASEFSDQSDP